MEKHPDVAKEMEAMQNEDPQKWGKEMKPKWEAAPEVQTFNAHRKNEGGPKFCCIGVNFTAAGYVDLGTLYTSAPFSHNPTCMRPVHFEASLWIALVRNMSMRPGNNGPLRIRPTQLGTELQGRLSLHPASLPRTLRRFAFALWLQP